MWTGRLRRSTEEFWSLTYREIYACIDDYFQQREEERLLQRAWNVRIGTVCATICNNNPFTESKKVWKWTDFFEDTNETSTAPTGQRRLSVTTKIRFQQLAARYQVRQAKQAGN